MFEEDPEMARIAAESDSVMAPLLGGAAPEEYVRAFVKVGIAVEVIHLATGWRPPGFPHLPGTS